MPSGGKKIIEKVQYRKTNYVVEADIRSFFDNVDHGWLLKMLSYDIEDRRFLEVIGKFLKAGIMENGKYPDSERGTPQGNGDSPILANIYLQYVLDNWFDVIVKRQCGGECYLIRYCDDFVCGFTFYCGMDGKKRFYRCKVKTSKKKFRGKIKAMKEWIKSHRTMPLEEMFKAINAKLQGHHYQYYGVTDNTRDNEKYA